MTTKLPHAEHISQGGDSMRAAIGKLGIRNAVDLLQNVVPPIFLVGASDHNRELIVDNSRILVWQLTGQEERLAAIAGWADMKHQITGKDGYLAVPKATRNARSLLSGTEAYNGEKRAIVDSAATYLKKAREEFGAEDTGFSWASVGVTPDHSVFIAPPNMGPDTEYADDVVRWRFDTVEELRILLQNDQANQDLVKNFREGLG